MQGNFFVQQAHLSRPAQVCVMRIDTFLMYGKFMCSEIEVTAACRQFEVADRMRNFALKLNVSAQQCLTADLIDNRVLLKCLPKIKSKAWLKELKLQRRGNLPRVCSTLHKVFRTLQDQGQDIVRRFCKLSRAFRSICPVKQSSSLPAARAPSDRFL